MAQRSIPRPYRRLYEAWISFKNGSGLEVSVEGDKRLFNHYDVRLVNPEKYPAVRKELGRRFIDELLSPEGQEIVGNYKFDGHSVFSNAINFSMPMNMKATR